MRPLISVADLIVMSAAAGVCFLPAGQFNSLRCTLAVIAANAAFFGYRMLRPAITPQPSPGAKALGPEIPVHRAVRSSSPYSSRFRS
jgi:hypothetical protein